MDENNMDLMDTIFHFNVLLLFRRKSLGSLRKRYLNLVIT